MKPKLILIGGGSASGKTYLSGLIKDVLGDEISIVGLDNFYRHRPDLTFEERVNVNYDHPDSMDNELIVSVFKNLLKGKAVDLPVYDFSEHLRTDKVNHINVNKYMIIDGIFSLCYPELLKLADYKIYIDADEDVRLARRIKRDVNERGRTRDSVLKQFKETVAPMHKQFIEKTKKVADYVLVNNSNDGISKTEVTRIVKAIQNLDN